MASLRELLSHNVYHEDGTQRIDFSGLAPHLPEYVPTGNIEVDLRTISEIMRIIRCDSLSVVGFRESGEDHLDIKGITTDGSAVGSGSSRKPQNKKQIGKKNRFAEVTYPAPQVSRSFDFRSCKILVNFSAIDDAGNLRDPQSVAKILDLAIKEQLKECAKERLAFDKTTFSVEFIVPLVVAIGAFTFKTPNSLRLLLGISMLAASNTDNPLLNTYLVLFALTRALMSGGDKEIDEAQRSIVNPLTLGDFEYDRLLIVWNILRKSPLISSRTLDSEQKQL